MAGTAHKGAIAFGMVYIPVALYTAVSSNGISFNQLSSDGKSRVKLKKVRADNGQEIQAGEIVKGYQYQKDQYVILSDDELERMKTPKDKSITIHHFCPIGSVDPIYFEKTYYAAPDGGDKAYALLLKVMRDENKMAIASTVLGTKETLITLLPGRDGLVAETMHYLEEIKAVPKPFAQPELSAPEIEMTKALLKTMDKPFEPELYHDGYREKLLQAIQQKIDGQEITAPNEEATSNVIDIMEALERSLAERDKMVLPLQWTPNFAGSRQ